MLSEKRPPDDECQKWLNSLYYLRDRELQKQQVIHRKIGALDKEHETNMERLNEEYAISLHQLENVHMIQIKEDLTCWKN